MLHHEAAQGRAMLDKERLLARHGIFGAIAEFGLEELAHALVDLREQVAARRVEGVVEIENPGLHLVERQGLGHAGS
jgi:hypothetical protein